MRRLDLLVVTHAALDHDGAAAAVLAEMPVGMVLDGEEGRAGREPARPTSRTAAASPPGRSGHAPPSRSRPSQPAVASQHLRSDAGQVLRVGPIELRVLWPRREPPAPAGAEPNDRATVIHLRDGGFDLLLTADAESNVTAGLDLAQVDALKVLITAATTRACRTCCGACVRTSR